MIVSELWHRLLDHYSKESVQSFDEQLSERRRRDLFERPLLRDVATTLRRCNRVEQIPCSDVVTLVLSNASPHDVQCAILPKIPDQGGVLALFEMFTTITRHSLELVDHREQPTFCAPIYVGNRYFAFHGGGSCVLMSLLFQGLAASVLGQEMTTSYFRHSSGSFSHCLCTSSGSRQFWDPDLKIAGDLEGIAGHTPESWILNLIEHLAPYTAEACPASFLSPEMEQYLGFLRDSEGRELSIRGGRFEKLLPLYRQTLASDLQEVLVTSDDHSWKQHYRNAVSAMDGSEGPADYFLARCAEPLRFEVPAGCELTLHPLEDPLREILDTLSRIYFGRRFFRLRIPIKAGSRRRFVAPECPWLLHSSSSRSVQVNGSAVDLVDAPDGRGWYATPASLTSRLGAFTAPRPLTEYALEISSQAETTVSIYLPANVSFWNSPYSQAHANGDDHLLSISYSV